MFLFLSLFACDDALQPVVAADRAVAPADEIRAPASCVDCYGDPLEAPKSCDQGEPTEPNDGDELGIPVEDGFSAAFSLQGDDVDTFVIDLPPHTRMELEVTFERAGGNVDLGLFMGPIEVDVVTGDDGSDSAVFSNVGDGWMSVAVDAYLARGEGCVLYDVEVRLQDL